MMECLEQLFCAVVEPAPVEPAQTPRLHPEEDIFGYREMRTKRELLMNVGNAATPRFQRIGRAIRQSLQGDASGVRAHGCRQDIHQRTLACAVLADGGVHLSHGHGKIHAAQSRSGSKAFPQAGDFKDCCSGHCRYLLSGGCNNCWTSGPSMLSVVTSITPVSIRFSTDFPCR